MSSKSYLSIGDVLTLLRQEFADITISKIRFLESQGLVNPERTPSGYRKFYEHDVERLRWVLRQQRENFLPLKVIKDRLDDDANGSVPAGEAAAVAPAATGSSEDTGSAIAGTPRDSEPVLVGQASSKARGATSADAGATGDGSASLDDDGLKLPGIESGAPAMSTTGTPRLSAAAGHSSASSSGPGTSATGPSVTHHSRHSDQQPTRVHPEAASAKRKSPSKSAPAPAPAPAARGATRGATAGASDAPPPPAGPSPSGSGSGDGGNPPAGSVLSSLSGRGGVSLSLDELSAACGLDPAVLRELEEYGLLTATSIAGMECFDEEALTVANLAAQFGRFGIEPRHLRLYKNAADREAGFVEQIVIPLVRRRNPDARARAYETADELARLGQLLRGSLLRTALADLLNG